MSTSRRVNFAVLAASACVILGACSSQDSASSSTVVTLSTTSSTAEMTTTSVPQTSATDVTVASTTTTLVPLDKLELTLEEVASGFDAPVFLVADPDGGDDLVVEQSGRILRINSRDVVLDIREDVTYGGERGLLGLAYHPDFGTNRLAYVNYVGASGSTIIDEFTVAADGAFELASRKEILRVAQPAGNHNGGMIAFGPKGYLWIGMGDGGGSNDRYGNAQRSDTLLGAMLRLAVGVDGVPAYAIPPDNPYADGEEGAPEVYWIGLRNPWRFSFDGRDVWIADVGQNAIEEVNVAHSDVRFLNFGWPVMEGTTCFESSSCDPSVYVGPVAEYQHGPGCSVSGGYVYRGSAIPELDGEYFYSDYCSGILASYSVTHGDLDWTGQVGELPNVSSFGIGGDGELYVVGHQGTIHRIERTR